MASPLDPTVNSNTRTLQSTLSTGESLRDSKNSAQSSLLGFSQEQVGLTSGLVGRSSINRKAAGKQAAKVGAPVSKSVGAQREERAIVELNNSKEIASKGGDNDGTGFGDAKGAAASARGQAAADRSKDSRGKGAGSGPSGGNASGGLGGSGGDRGQGAASGF